MNGQAEGLLRRKARPLTYPLPTLAVTSARRGSGATTVARNVAASHGRGIKDYRRLGCNHAL